MAVRHHRGMDHEQHSPNDLPRILLIPGYWLGGWAWERVQSRLCAAGFAADSLTLPGLEGRDADRSGLRLRDHVQHILARMDDADPCVLVAHSGAGALATVITDIAPGAVRRVVYVDSGPVDDGTIPRPDLPPDAVDLPFPGLDALAANGTSVEGIDDADRALIEARAVPHPAGVVREAVRLHDPRRNAVPATMICCSLSAETVRRLAAAGSPMFRPVNALTDLTPVNLPTGHWPMFSRPGDLADIIAEEASRA